MNKKAIFDANYEKKRNSNELDIRRSKLLQLREENIAFTNDFRRKNVSNQLRRKYLHKNNIELMKSSVMVSVAGRIINQRIIGKASFIILRDMGGCIQLYVNANSISIKLYEKILKQWDVGDILGAKGTLFKTNTGELSIHCKEIRILTKSLRSLPSKFHGLHNQEIKYRQRYLDLITNDQSRKVFQMRSLIISEIRQFMIQHDFMEVETPMMHSISGGAIAKPFTTYHNGLRMNMYLRVAPELYLKKLVIGGFERIFEINRNFRNEGISSHHNPEFTMMEVYMAYADYHDMIVLVQNLLQTLVSRILGGDNIVNYGEHSLNFKNDFIKMTIKEAIFYYLPDIRSKNINDIYVVSSIARSFGIAIDNHWTLNKIYMVIFEEVISKKIIQPTYIISYPVEVSPLARRNNDDPMVTDRFELFIAGYEIGNGFSELNDPDDQRKRFIEQLKEKRINSDKVDYDTDYDEDYLVALEHGLPPTAGVGIGIDRLIMLLTNTHSIRDVILFPTLKPKRNVC